MRVAPVLLPHPSPALWADTALAAMLTHNDSASTATCLAFARLLWELIGRTKSHDDGQVFRLVDAACDRWVPPIRERMSVPHLPGISP